MTYRNLALVASMIATPALAQQTREMDAHEHGVSSLELAMEHGVVEMNLTSPGMDIVGFEYVASSAEDKDSVEAAIRAFLVPENMIALPDEAECRLTEVLAHLHAGEHHHDEAHEHEEHEGHDHAEEDHAEEEHDGEDHADHGEHAHDDHDTEDSHSEFHARYIFACEHPENLTKIGFPFFERFENAKEIEAQFVTETGAGAVEIDRANAELSLN